MSIPVVLIHGLGDDRTAWSSVIPLLESIGPCTAVDLPGFGSNRERVVRSIDLVAEDVAQVIDRVDGERCIVIGHSLGGVVATMVAELRPRSVAALINVEGNLTPDDCTFSREAAESTDFGTWFEQFASNQPRRYRSALGKCNPAAFLAMSKELVRLSADAELAHRLMFLRMPAEYWHGSLDFSPRSRATLRASGVASRMFPGAGHWVMSDKPAEFAQATHGFVDGALLEAQGRD